jgi:hypothetical protein
MDLGSVFNLAAEFEGFDGFEGRVVWCGGEEVCGCTGWSSMLPFN